MNTNRVFPPNHFRWPLDGHHAAHAEGDQKDVDDEQHDELAVLVLADYLDAAVENVAAATPAPQRWTLRTLFGCW